VDTQPSGRTGAQSGLDLVADGKGTDHPVQPTGTAT
jgi:hypothetical protein